MRGGRKKKRGEKRAVTGTGEKGRGEGESEASVRRKNNVIKQIQMMREKRPMTRVGGSGVLKSTQRTQNERDGHGHKICLFFFIWYTYKLTSPRT